MLYCIGEPEDVEPAKIRSVSQGCGEFGINRLYSAKRLSVRRPQTANAAARAAR
jgi:hypothetical protein